MKEQTWAPAHSAPAHITLPALPFACLPAGSRAFGILSGASIHTAEGRSATSAMPVMF